MADAQGSVDANLEIDRKAQKRGITLIPNDLKVSSQRNKGSNPLLATYRMTSHMGLIKIY